MASGTKTKQKYSVDIWGPLGRAGPGRLSSWAGVGAPPSPLNFQPPHLADAAGVIEAVTDGVVVLFPAWTLGRQQHVH